MDHLNRIDGRSEEVIVFQLSVDWPPSLVATQAETVQAVNQIDSLQIEIQFLVHTLISTEHQ